MKENPFVNGPLPGTTGKPLVFPVVRPMPDKPLTLTFCGLAIWCYWTHVVAGRKPGEVRSVLCYGPEECNPEHHAITPRWAGFCGVELQPKFEPAVVMLTLRAAELVVELAQKNGSLRGLSVTLGKESNHSKGATLVGTWVRYFQRPLLPPFGVGDSLCRCFRVSKLPTHNAETLWYEGEAAS